MCWTLDKLFTVSYSIGKALDALITDFWKCCEEVELLPIQRSSEKSKNHLIQQFIPNIYKCW